MIASAGTAGGAPEVVESHAALPRRLARGRPKSAPIDATGLARQEIREGFWLAGFLSFGFAFLYWRDISGFELPAFILGLIMAAMCVRAALFRPRQLPLLLTAYLPWNVCFAYAAGGGINMTNFLLGLLFLSWLSQRRKSGRRIPLKPLEYVVIAYLAIGFLGHVMATFELNDLSPLEFVLVTKVVASPFLIFFLIRALVRDREEIRAILMVMAVSITFVSTVCIVEGWDRRAGSIEKSRIRGPLLQANSIGAFLAYYGPPVFAGALQTRRRAVRGLGLLSFLMVLYSVQFTYSRGALLALALSATLIFLLRNPLYLIGSVGLYLGTASVFPQIIPESALARLNHTFQKPEDAIYEEHSIEQMDGSARERIEIWTAAEMLIKDHPILGVGWGRFPDYLPIYRPPVEGERHASDAHNMFVLVTSESGIPAGLLLILMMLLVLQRALFTYWRSRDPVERTAALGLVGTMVAVIFSCVFGSRFADEALVGQVWVLAGCVAIADHQSRADRLVAKRMKAMALAERQTRVPSDSTIPAPADQLKSGLGGERKNVRVARPQTGFPLRHQGKSMISRSKEA